MPPSGRKAAKSRQLLQPTFDDAAAGLLELLSARDIQLLLTGRSQHHVTTVLPVEYAHVQNVCYVKLLTTDTPQKRRLVCSQ